MRIAWIYKCYSDSEWLFINDEPDDWVFLKKQIVWTEVL